MSVSDTMGGCVWWEPHVGSMTRLEGLGIASLTWSLSCPYAENFGRRIRDQYITMSVFGNDDFAVSCNGDLPL